jgi:hypothetical protein
MMKYSEGTKLFVERVVTEWHDDGKYPNGWKLENQIKGAHAECAAFICRYGNEESGIKEWFEAASQKREEFGNDPKQKDDYDVVGSNGELIDAKWIPDYDQIWVTESTHRHSTYDLLAGVKFDPQVSEFEVHTISRSDFDRLSTSPSKNKLRVFLPQCKKVTNL